MTPQQRRLRWVKWERLPPNIQALIKKPKDQVKKEKPEVPVEAAPVTAVPGKKELQETILNPRSDYLKLDFSKLDNVTQKLKEA